MESKNYFKLKLNAEKYIAYDSPDHLNPWGTARDNSRNLRFNEKIYEIFSLNKKPLKVLDLGCSGGGFVKDCHDDGCLAIGLEGSDFSKIYKRAEWATIPDNLFTCDITKPFSLYISNGQEDKKIIFDLITSWEVLEHIRVEDIQQIVLNVTEHMSDNSLWIMSIATDDDIINGVNLHQTVKPKNWWINKFSELGLSHIEAFEKYFQSQYIRGKKYGAGESFHLILTKNILKAPPIPTKSIFGSLWDIWLGSKIQRAIKKILIGPSR